MNNSGKIICPTITVWIIFIINFILIYYLLFFKDEISEEQNKQKSPKEIRFDRFETSSLIINFIIELTASILVTISFENKKFLFYLIGIFMSLIFEIYTTTYIVIKKMNDSGNKTPEGIFNMIIEILIEWSQLTVLIIYYKRVKSSFNISYLNPNLVNNNDNEIEE